MLDILNSRVFKFEAACENLELEPEFVQMISRFKTQSPNQSPGPSSSPSLRRSLRGRKGHPFDLGLPSALRPRARDGGPLRRTRLEGRGTGWHPGWTRSQQRPR